MAILKTLQYILPGIKWMRNYKAQDAIADLIAGTTVGLTVLPQGLAYATLAGLEPQYGLYSAFVGGIIYAFLGSCPQVTIGPTALLALMTSRHTDFGLDSGPAFAILLCLISGVVELLMAILRLGALVDLISLPVTVGFTSATAVIISASQLKGLLGLRGDSGSDFLDTMKFVFRNLSNIHLADFILGITALIILLLLRKLKDLNFQNGTRIINVRNYRYFKYTAWVISTGRNALIVLIASTIAYNMCGKRDVGVDCPITLTSTVKSGLPDFQLPKFETTILSKGKNNQTIEIQKNFNDMISEMGFSIIFLPIIAVLGNVAISKSFASPGINPTRELIALSFSNIFGSFFSSMPVTGSFSRSAVNHASGVRTPIGGLYTSVLVLLALGLLTPYFQYIPKAALSAVIISAVIFMIEYEVIKPLWKCNRRELLPGVITFVVSLTFGVEIGLLLGVSSDLAYLIYRAARPSLNVSKLKTTNGIDYIHMGPRYSLLYFPAIEWIRSGIHEALTKYDVIPIILDCTHIEDCDFTAARGLCALHKELSNRQTPIFLMKTSKKFNEILKESSNLDFPTIDCPDDLEAMLEQKGNGNYDSYPQARIPLLDTHTIVHPQQQQSMYNNQATITTTEGI